jgi:hypothetical protein
MKNRPEYFTALASADADKEAGPNVEKALLQAFRRRARVAVWIRQWAWGAIAASLGLVWVAVRHPAEPVRQPVARVEAPVVAEVPAPSVSSPVVTVRRARPRPVRTPAAREIATGFIPLMVDPDPPDRGRLVRVRLPRSALTVFGLPVNEERSEDRIQADVFVGEDGMARAIRFVR